MSKQKVIENLPEVSSSIPSHKSKRFTSSKLDRIYQQVVSYLENAHTLTLDPTLDLDFLAEELTDAINLFHAIETDLIGKHLAEKLASFLANTLSLTQNLIDDPFLTTVYEMSEGLATVIKFDDELALLTLYEIFEGINVLIESDPNLHTNKESTLLSYLKISNFFIESLILLLESEEMSLNIRLTFSDQNNLPITPRYLNNIISPFLIALNQIQYAVDEINGTESEPVEIITISKGSVTVDITGGIRDTIELVMDLIVPYRRKTKKRQAELDVATKEIEVKQKEADLKKAQATLGADSEQANVDVEKAQVEVALLRQQERELALKNKKQELELFELTLAMVDKIKDDLPDSERLYYATKLLDPTRLIATSPLELISAKPIISEDSSEGQ